MHAPPPREEVRFDAGVIAELRTLAFGGLARMYDRETGRFVFRLRKHGRTIAAEGSSTRYTAISLIGLAGESREATREVLAGASVEDVAQRLVDSAPRLDNLGDLALTAWAACAVGHSAVPVWKRLLDLDPDVRPHPTVELAWTLSALSHDADAWLGDMRARIASRLLNAFSRSAGLFPHYIGGPGPSSGRSHVSCFADLVYPTLALAQFGQAFGDAVAVGCAARCAETMYRLQGQAGQWWWHFDYRTGRIIERYPVYAVHQDSMAPMALFAAAEAASLDFDAAIARGLDWLRSAPELGGRTLIDRPAGLIWRKVARREPAKLARYVQAAASRVSPNLRAPGLDPLFPPTAIDFEDRPYHLGWVLYAWPAHRTARGPGHPGHPGQGRAS